MFVRVHSTKRQGMLLRRIGSRRPFTVAYGEIVTAERMASRLGFRLHAHGWESLVVLVRRSAQRGFEEELRAGGVVIVDDLGARIDESQFEKEVDPEFNRNVDDGFPPFLLAAFAPMFVLRWWERWSMRQSSDDATGE